MNDDSLVGFAFAIKYVLKYIIDGVSLKGQGSHLPFLIKT